MPARRNDASGVLTAAPAISRVAACPSLCHAEAFCAAAGTTLAAPMNVAVTTINPRSGAVIMALCSEKCVRAPLT